MLTYDLEARDGVPLYEYLYRRVRDDILSGALAAGERLPSKRALAEHLRISVVTVENAYQQLEAEGFLLSNQIIGQALEALAGEKLRREEAAARHDYRVR